MDSINPDVIRESACGDSKAAVELLELYFAHAEQETACLVDAVAANNAFAVAELAHKLVGSSLSCGLVGLAGDLRTLEQLCRNDGIPFDIDERIQALLLRLAEARSFFEDTWEAD